MEGALRECLSLGISTQASQLVLIQIFGSQGPVEQPAQSSPLPTQGTWTVFHVPQPRTGHEAARAEWPVLGHCLSPLGALGWRQESKSLVTCRAHSCSGSQVPSCPHQVVKAETLTGADWSKRDAA